VADAVSAVAPRRPARRTGAAPALNASSTICVPRRRNSL
jgi:hypothetical protein